MDTRGFFRGIKRPNTLRNVLLSQGFAGSPPLKVLSVTGRISNIIRRYTESPTFSSQAVPRVSRPPVAFSTPNPTPTSEINRVNDLNSFRKQPNSKIYISIMDVRWVRRNASLGKQLALDFIPKTLDFSPVSTVSPLKVLGANNPTYHFGGSEDTLVIKVEWYGYTDKPILEKCRFIESLCKADGWSSGPPLVSIDWAGNPAFKNQLFIVTKAPYSVRHFAHRRGPGANVKDYNLGPIQGTQTLTLKRVARNQLTHHQIRTL